MRNSILYDQIGCVDAEIVVGHIAPLIAGVEFIVSLPAFINGENLLLHLLICEILPLRSARKASLDP